MNATSRRPPSSTKIRSLSPARTNRAYPTAATDGEPIALSDPRSVAERGLTPAAGAGARPCSEVVTRLSEALAQRRRRTTRVPVMPFLNVRKPYTHIHRYDQIQR